MKEFSSKVCFQANSTYLFASDWVSLVVEGT